MDHWLVLYTKPHGERQVEEALAAKGIETYYPAVPVPHRKGRPAVRPYFPCYLFARCDVEVVGLNRLNWTPGIRHVVTFGGAPAQMDDGVIVRIRERLAQRDMTVDEHGEILARGDRVVITSGPLQDIEAVFDRRLTGHGRVRVLIRLLERWAGCEVDAGDLRQVGGAAR